MKFETANKLEKIVSKDETRFALTHAYHDKDASMLVATNGHMLVALPVTENSTDDSGFVPVDALKAARKAKGLSESPDVTIVDGKVSCPRVSMTFAPDTEGCTFPEWKRGLPSFNPSERNVATITLNAKYLAALAEAMGSDNDAIQLTFSVDDSYGPVMVRATGNNPAVGVIMPIRNNVNGAARVNPATNPHIVNAEGKRLATDEERAA